MNHSYFNPQRILSPLLFAVAAIFAAGGAQAQEPQRLPALEVVAPPISDADSASTGESNDKALAQRPLLRPGALLEAVPGLIVTQHSGEGKANQYFLRAFNLDHGTDLAVNVDGMPINQPTHGHGQGYIDLNFLIPEVVAGEQYQKGPYFADQGDFSSAGAVRMRLLNEVAPGYGAVSAGQGNFHRALVVQSPEAGGGRLLYALEAYGNDGPYEHPQDYNKINGLLRYSRKDGADLLAISAMVYDGKWNSTDQVPKRAIDGGLIGRFGTLDASDGGAAARQSVSANWSRSNATAQTRLTAYMVRSRLDLFSNFTFFLDDPVSGDQFSQHDDRVTTGLEARHSRSGDWGARDIVHTVGLQLRHDDIDVALAHTRERQTLETRSDNHVRELGSALYYENAVQWQPRWRSVFGLRGDWFNFDVDDRLDARNSGSDSDAIVSPKLSLIAGPWESTTYFVNAGYGYHSNDARGVTKTVDPASGMPLAPVTPLVRTKSAEVGLRHAPGAALQTEVAVFLLDIQSELVFVGDAGTTEPSGATRRVGVEWANRYQPRPWLGFDANLAVSQGRFREDVGDAPHQGRYIPGAPTAVAAAGATVQRPDGWFGSLRLRYFGARPLLEDKSVESDAFTVFDARVGYEASKKWKVFLDVFNLFDTRWNDIEYFYTSRLNGEPAAGVDDLHLHPGEPRTLRFSVVYYSR